MRDSRPGADDPFKPPDIPIEVGCLHCGEAYDSYLIYWVECDDFPGGGYWGGPTEGCDGKGFCFDIWPTDPEWRDENGEKVFFVDDGDEEGAEDLEWNEDEECEEDWEFDEGYIADSEWKVVGDGEPGTENEDDTKREYDPLDDEDIPF